MSKVGTKLQCYTSAWNKEKILNGEIVEYEPISGLTKVLWHDHYIDKKFNVIYSDNDMFIYRKEGMIWEKKREQVKLPEELFAI